MIKNMSTNYNLYAKLNELLNINAKFVSEIEKIKSEIMPEYIEIHNQDDFLNRPRNDHLRIIGQIEIDDMDIAAGLPVETWDMSKCRNMSNMFRLCENVPAGISEWDTSACTKMNSIFARCKNVPDISKWNVSACVSMHNMFRGCITIPAGISKWDVSKCVNMKHMFCGCNKIPDISGWNVSAKTMYNLLNRL